MSSWPGITGPGAMGIVMSGMARKALPGCLVVEAGAMLPPGLPVVCIEDQASGKIGYTRWKEAERRCEDRGREERGPTNNRGSSADERRVCLYQRALH